MKRRAIADPDPVELRLRLVQEPGLLGPVKSRDSPKEAGATAQMRTERDIF